MPFFRCNHKIEAVQWTGEDIAELREMHKRRTGHELKFEYRPVVLVNDEWHGMDVGEWLAWSHNELLVFDAEMFGAEYEPYDGEV